jgi:ABC-type nitrate/sulfonate/bicarbonate transport system ATPase subunit
MLYSELESHYSILAVNNLSYSYGKASILKNLSFHLNQGEFLTLLGKSGSGKSTLFKLLAGILTPHQGSVDATPFNVAYMMQEDLLLPWRTVLQNTLLFTELGSITQTSNAILEEAKTLLSELGLSKFIHHYPHQLSKGMRQRTALVRTLLQKKPIILLDEPFNGLDIALKEQLLDYLTNRQQKEKMAILMVTHDFHDAISYANRILFLNDGCIKKTWSIPEKSNLVELNALKNSIKNSFLDL